ncbi:hypothetical protein TIFTF001_027398 [Ficus carica]|uniref:Uncharacterized protein n=1 Tax=Ficus carica TaxID=3494 RepID=A0AA88DMW5_FICCA|nr:hypothetical protein TIFTF001_027398 [Ficus carica]
MHGARSPCLPTRQISKPHRRSQIAGHGEEGEKQKLPLLPELDLLHADLKQRPDQITVAEESRRSRGERKTKEKDLREREKERERERDGR